MLQLNNIEVVYSEVILVLKGISISVPKGGIVALLGANGAGKTTTLKAVSGILRLQNGELEGGSILLENRPIQDEDPDQIVRMGISMVPEGRRIFSDLSVWENLMVGAFSRPDRKAVNKDLEMVLNYFPVIKQRKGQRAIFLSGGEQQMVAVGRALMAKPKLIMLDEPSLGLAPLVVKDIFRILLQINREQEATLLLVEQNANLALNFASYGYIMENGRIVLDGNCAELKQNPDVQEFYLGVTEDQRRKSYADVKHYKRRKRWLS
jgi:branched-chain amino acid transport system ATP-binding protein